MTNSRLTGGPQPSLLGNQQAGQEARPPPGLGRDPLWVRILCTHVTYVLVSYDLFSLFLTTEFWGA